MITLKSYYGNMSKLWKVQKNQDKWGTADSCLLAHTQNRQAPIRGIVAMLVTEFLYLRSQPTLPHWALGCWALDSVLQITRGHKNLSIRGHQKETAKMEEEKETCSFFPCGSSLPPVLRSITQAMLLHQKHSASLSQQLIPVFSKTHRTDFITHPTTQDKCHNPAVPLPKTLSFHVALPFTAWVLITATSSLWSPSPRGGSCFLQMLLPNTSVFPSYPFNSLIPSYRFLILYSLFK